MEGCNGFLLHVSADRTLFWVATVTNLVCALKSKPGRGVLENLEKKGCSVRGGFRLSGPKELLRPGISDRNNPIFPSNECTSLLATVCSRLKG